VASRQGLHRAICSLDAVDLGLGEKADLRPGPEQGLRRTYLTIYGDGRFQGVRSLERAAP
jgi:hypothetical protein